MKITEINEISENRRKSTKSLKSTENHRTSMKIIVGSAPRAERHPGTALRLDLDLCQAGSVPLSASTWTWPRPGRRRILVVAEGGSSTWTWTCASTWTLPRRRRILVVAEGGSSCRRKRMFLGLGIVSGMFFRSRDGSGDSFFDPGMVLLPQTSKITENQR